MGTLTTLYDFCVHSRCPDGVNPYGGLSQATNGTFYGVTLGGGIVSCDPSYYWLWHRLHSRHGTRTLRGFCA
jgi:hypothetical protein